MPATDQPLLVPAVNPVTHPGVRINFTPNTIELLANQAYTTYKDQMGGKAFDGTPLQEWEAVSKLPQGEGWRAAVRRVLTFNANV